MRVEKRRKYIDNLRAGLHTLSGKADQLDEQRAAEEPIIKSCFPKKVRNQDRREYYLQFNPNKIMESGKVIHRYSDFERVLFGMLDNISAVNFRISRADLSIDSSEPGDFKTFQKLNRLILCCLAYDQNMKNCYQSQDLWTQKGLSIAVKNDRIEAENYDKSKESAGKAEATSRLELRTKRISGTLEMEFMVKWFERLDKAVDCFEAVQRRYNDELSRLWLEDRQKPQKDRDYLNLTGFVLQYKDCFFSKRQLQSFFEIIGEENPAKKAKNFKDRHHVEFFSRADLQEVVKGIKQAITAYFTS